MEPAKLEKDVADLKKHLEIARTEIKNLRSQVISMKHSFQKDTGEIQRQIDQGISPPPPIEPATSCECELAGWRSIGVINTWFPGKRGVPRQASLSPEAQGVLTLSPVVINNPAYSLSGLEEFSHIWIIFHFHQTCGSHVKTKVAPPRLGGARVGLFGTRSPHRPCPIGLSLVKLEKIEGNVVYFTGVDMVDGTPVFDIKPYIPQYDDPRCLPSRTEITAAYDESDSTGDTADAATNSDSQDAERHVEGEGAESPLRALSQLNIQVPESAENLATSSHGGMDATTLGFNASTRSRRETPDGEEGPVQVASWVTSPPTRPLKVEFADRVLTQLASLPENEGLQATITRLLEQDPRSNYLRRKLGSQFYTFRIDPMYVSVKFDDNSGIVTVISLQQAV